MQALKHAYFDGFSLSLPTNAPPLALHPNSSQSKNFFNAANDFQKPSSKARIESRKGVLSRKSSINKNSFYRSKAVGKVPDFLPNKPTVVGSRGQNIGSGYLNRNANGAGSPKLPNLSSSGGITGNANFMKNSAAAIRGNQNSGGGGLRGRPNLNVFQKYTSGLGGGGGGISSDPY